MTKKSETLINADEKVGKKGIFVMFDESRLLRLDLMSMAWIEENVLSGRALAINQVMLNLNRVGFLKTVLRATLGIEHNKPKISDEDMQAIVEGYIENTGDLADLQKTLQEVYDMATKNPMKLAASREKKVEDPGGKA